MKLSRFFLLAVLTGLGSVSCASINGTCNIKGGYDFSKLPKIAVVEVTFGNRGSIDEYSAAANQIADLITAEFFNRGYETVERAQIESVLKEQDFQHSGMTSDQDAAAIGKILNVPAVVVANVQEAGENFIITVKAIDTQTASHLLMGNGKGEARSGLTRISTFVGGAAVGAGAGAAIGGRTGAGIGALGGALGGLVAGEMLSEDIYDVAQKTIAKVFEKLPPKS